MAKERAINPAAAQRKAEKQKALKKGKAAVAAQRNERLAHRNPERLQRQIDDIKAQTDSSGQLSTRYKKTLDDLEHELARVSKAKEVVGDKYAERRLGRQNNPRGERQVNAASPKILGKRGRSYHPEHTGTSSDTDEGVDVIPMPRDTPPPIPRMKRSIERLGVGSHPVHRPPEVGEVDSVDLALPQRPQTSEMPSQTVYESRPVIRDLRKEAIGFVPSAVQKRIDLSKGTVGTRLLQEDELQALEAQGYGKKGAASGNAESKRPEMEPKYSKGVSKELPRHSNHVQIEEVPEGPQ